MSKFKVGDIIVGNALAVRHSITIPGWKGRVIRTIGTTKFAAACLRTGNTYNLRDDAFDLVDQRVPLGESPLIHRNGSRATVERTDDPERPFAAVVAGHRLSFDKFGNFYPRLECPIDLVNI